MAIKRKTTPDENKIASVASPKIAPDHLSVSPAIQKNEPEAKIDKHTVRCRAQLDDLKGVVPESELGVRLHEARARLNLSQEGLSRRTKEFDSEKQGISRTVLTGYEKGKFKPGTRELRILYQALGVSPNWLILGLNDPTRSRVYVDAFGSEEMFESELLKALKKLDSDSLNGVAHLIFLASENVATTQRVLDFAEANIEKIATAFDNLEKIEKKLAKKNKTT